MMKNYFAYLPPSPREAVWGASVTALGFARVKPGGTYPAGKHPDDHHFSWERGRVLEVFQLVLISDGEGILESGRPSAAWRVTGGQMFILFPGVWHRYAPSSKTGWVEHWIECRGVAFESVRKLGILSPVHPVIELNGDTTILETLMRCHDRAAEDPLDNQDILASLALHCLSLLVQVAGRTPGPARAQARSIQRACQLIMDRCDRPLDMSSIAREVGMGYSHFRQSFRRQYGMGAREFHFQVRMRRACDMLANTELPIKEIAEALGYSSAFHFSNAFKLAKDIAPKSWRDAEEARRGTSRLHSAHLE